MNIFIFSSREEIENDLELFCTPHFPCHDPGTNVPL